MANRRRLSNKHKAYAATLVAAVSALAYDQCRAPTPRSGRAAAAVAPPSPTAAVAVPVAADRAEAVPGAAEPVVASDLAGRLRALAGGPDPMAGLQDAFAPSPAWAADRRAAQALTPTDGGGVDAAAFAAGHKLSMVLLSRGRSGSAVIGGRLVSAGQTVDGYRLAWVGPRSARLDGPGGGVDLLMP